jgi:amidase
VRAVSHDTDLARLDACGQAELVRTGQASPTELVDAAIARIEAVNPQLNAVIHERFERARAEAASELPDGPFRGVPFLLKDLEAHHAGEPHHGGLKVLAREGWVASADDHLTRRVREAGLVVLGRTNTPELGTTISTEPEAHGPTRNPWDLERSAGGSSGGSGAAVASLMVPAAHASDGGGSIRIPASENGLVGLKPTRARVSQGPRVGDSWAGATVHGTLSRTVRDAAALLDALAGAEVGDPYPAPPLPGPLADEVGRDPGRLRVGVLEGPLLPGVEGDADVADAVAAAAELLQELGHHVTDDHPVAMEDGRFIDTFTTVVAANVALELDVWAAELGRELTADDVEERNWMFAAIGRATTAPQYLEAVQWQQEWSRRMAGWWEGDGEAPGFDLLVCPVLNGPPPPLGWLMDPVEGLGRVTTLMQFTAQFNVTGQPAISLPLSWNAAELPIGVQLVAPFGREDLLIRVAAQLERAAPWADRIPPVHA